MASFAPQTCCLVPNGFQCSSQRFLEPLAFLTVRPSTFLSPFYDALWCFLQPSNLVCIESAIYPRKWPLLQTQTHSSSYCCSMASSSPSERFPWSLLTVRPQLFLSRSYNTLCWLSDLRFSSNIASFAPKPRCLIPNGFQGVQFLIPSESAFCTSLQPELIHKNC